MIYITCLATFCMFFIQLSFNTSFNIWHGVSTVWVLQYQNTLEFEISKLVTIKISTLEAGCNATIQQTKDKSEKDPE